VCIQHHGEEEGEQAGCWRRRLTHAGGVKTGGPAQVPDELHRVGDPGQRHRRGVLQRPILRPGERRCRGRTFPIQPRRHPSATRRLPAQRRGGRLLQRGRRVRDWHGLLDGWESGKPPVLPVPLRVSVRRRLHGCPPTRLPCALTPETRFHGAQAMDKFPLYPVPLSTATRLNNVPAAGETPTGGFTDGAEALHWSRAGDTTHTTTCPDAD